MGKAVLVRTYSAGVFFGYLVSQNGKEVTLENARRLWRWRGAKECCELAIKGPIADWTRLSERTKNVVLTEAIEIHDCQPEAIHAFETIGWAE